MDNKILYTAKFTHHDLKFHKVWWKSDKRCGSWSGQTDRQTDRQADSYIRGGITKEQLRMDNQETQVTSGTRDNKQNKGVIRSCKKTNDDLQNLVSDKIHTCMSIRKVNRQWRDDRHQVMAKSDKNNKNNILPYFFFDIIIKLEI